MEGRAQEEIQTKQNKVLLWCSTKYMYKRILN